MYIADLHIHSRFSMATSRQLTIPHLAGWAMCKGINVLGTGDFTHPAWQKELEDGLEFDEASGFYTMKGQADRLVVEKNIADAKPPFFCLQTEISSIYKRGGKSRRVHNLVYFRHLDDVKRFSKKLAQIGNIESDGRPILGLDSKDLLELVLETSDTGVLIPAHIWTPWFSLFGSKSGFDAIEECFGDLTPHIFALETGLSSDPAMNRLVSSLDKYVLVSNSDAHSGANLGREANLFHGTPTYDGMFDALRRAARRETRENGESFKGTLEIYPEEGKYHLDGHRHCKVVMTPEESAARNDICPVCGKPLTIGVLHRVWELADRKEPVQLENAPEVNPIIPLPTILAQIRGVSTTSKVVTGLFRDALEHLGSEFTILAHLPVEQIAEYNPSLAEAVRRIRQGEIELRGGYDGEFGTIKIFSDEELKDITASAGPALVRRGGRSEAESAPDRDRSSDQKTKHQLEIQPDASFYARLSGAEKKETLPAGTVRLTEEQESACRHEGHPLVVIAGPGSGKTRLLTERLVRLLKQGTAPADMLALTFSRKAAEEMLERVSLRLPDQALPFCGTFHALAWKLLHAARPEAVLLTEMQARTLLDRACGETIPMADAKIRRQYADRFWLARETCKKLRAHSAEARLAARYAELKREGGVFRVDFTDLLEWLAAALKSGKQKLAPTHVLVDEIQDLSLLQVRILHALLPRSGAGFFGIGDPDQAIYGFRGAARDIVGTFRTLWPGLAVTSLKTSFRSSQKILDAASLAMGGREDAARLHAAVTFSAELTAYEAPTQGMEERWVADQILRLLPSSSHTLLDEQKQAGGLFTGTLVPSDIAILVRVRAQIPSLAKALWKRGVPVQSPSMRLFWQEEGMDKVLSFMEEQLGRERKTFGLGPLAGLQKNTVSPSELVPVLRAGHLLSDDLLHGAAWKQLEKAYAEAGSWEKLFEDVCWQKEVDLLQTKAESVRLLTMHAAKGLEFKAVFLPGFNDGFLPHDRELLSGGKSSVREEELEEERRLLYVALTRASQAVYVSWARERHLYGKNLELGPSRFWPDLSGLFAYTRLVRHVRRTLTQGSLL